ARRVLPLLRQPRATARTRFDNTRPPRHNAAREGGADEPRPGPPQPPPVRAGRGRREPRAARELWTAAVPEPGGAAPQRPPGWLPGGRLGRALPRAVPARPA